MTKGGVTIAGSSKGRTLGSCPSNGGSTPPPATIWQRFANLLGIEERHAEDALYSERVAKHVVSRRSFLGAAGALAGAAVFAFPAPAQDEAKRIGSGLKNIQELMKRQFSVGPQQIFMNPRDYEMLRAELQDLPPIERDKFCPQGQAFIMPKPPPLTIVAIDQKRGIITFDSGGALTRP